MATAAPAAAGEDVPVSTAKARRSKRPRTHSSSSTTPTCIPHAEEKAEHGISPAKKKQKYKPRRNAVAMFAEDIAQWPHRLATDTAAEAEKQAVADYTPPVGALEIQRRDVAVVAHGGIPRQQYKRYYSVQCPFHIVYGLHPLSQVPPTTFLDGAIRFLGEFGVDFEDLYGQKQHSLRDATPAVHERLLRKLFDAHSTSFDPHASWQEMLTRSYSLGFQQEYKAAQHRLDAVYDMLEKLPAVLIERALTPCTDLPVDLMRVIASYLPVSTALGQVLAAKAALRRQDFYNVELKGVSSCLTMYDKIDHVLSTFTAPQNGLSIIKQYPGSAPGRVHNVYDFVRVAPDAWSARVNNLGPKHTTKELVFAPQRRVEHLSRGSLLSNDVDVLTTAKRRFLETQDTLICQSPALSVKLPPSSLTESG